ncbi:MAG: hypothetical protein KatS3mg119_1313 [Rhodothalassiaceae bacterium]|nr:MAG: hypothetical protein KatS3mg119_1313 [Rhodothalassiaceae bacterium]
MMVWQENFCCHDVVSLNHNLTQVTGPVNLTLAYDALGRLERLIESGQDTRFLYDGAQVIAELDAASGAVKRRYVPGPGTNEVVAWYEGAGVGERRFIHQDERGSVVAVANGAGAAIATFRYGPWGESSDTAFTRFGYTGALRLPGTDLLHMRARVYATALARFLEPDPIGFASGQLNLYSYVGGDPINFTDPSGLKTICQAGAPDCTPGPMVDPIDCFYRGAKLVCPSTGVSGFSGGINSVPRRFFIPGVSVGSGSIPGTNGNHVQPRLISPDGEGGDMSLSLLEMMGEQKVIAGCKVGGRVKTRQVSFDLFLVLGIGLNVGRFENIETGQTGLFASLEFGGGLDFSLGYSMGEASSAEALNGGSVFVSGGYEVAEGQLEFAFNDFLESSGMSGTAGVALGLPAGGSAGLSLGFIVCP